MSAVAAALAVPFLLHPPLPSCEPAPALRAHWARHADEVREAQRLRWQVFVDELGASPPVAPGTPPGHDADRFDPCCEHLLVRLADGPEAGLLVGTYRLLSAAGARRAGGFYTETEFDLSPLAAWCTHDAVELGRACVHADWRSGAVIAALWGALAEHMLRRGAATAIGCASIGMADGGHAAASLWRRLSATHLAAPEWRIAPRLPLPVEALRGDLAVEPPPLVRGYLRLGARLLGPPAWDPDFRTADLPLVLRLADLPPRWRRRVVAHTACA